MSSTKILYTAKTILFFVLFVSLWAGVVWITQKGTWLLQVREDWPVIHFNSVICFLLLSIAQLIPKYKKGRISALLTLTVLAIATLTLAQYMFKVDWGINHFFLKILHINPVIKYRDMALSTVICLVLTSLTWFLHRPFYSFDILAVTNSTLVFGFALINLASYLFNFNAEYGWGSHARMAFLASVGFVLISIVFLLQLSLDVRKRYRVRFAFVPFHVLIATIFLTLVIWHLLLQRDQEANRRITQLQAVSLKTSLDQSFDPLRKVLGHIARRHGLGIYQSQKIWLDDAQSYFKEFAFMRRIFMTDATGEIRWIYPLVDGGREVLVSHRNLRATQVSKYMELLRQGQRFVTTDIFPLRSTGDKAFVFLSSSKKNEKFYGAVGAAVYAEAFFSHVLNLENYDISVKENNDIVYRRGTPDSNIAKLWKSQLLYENLGVRWDIELIPRPEVIRAQGWNL